MFSFLHLCLISTLLLVSYAQQRRVGNPIYIFCDVRNLGGCFTEFRDPITCSGLDNTENALIEALPTNRYTTAQNADKLIFFSIKNKVEMPPIVMSVGDIGLESASRSLSYVSHMSYRSNNIPPNTCVVKRDEVTSRIIKILGPKGMKLTTLMMMPFGCRCLAL